MSCVYDLLGALPFKYLRYSVDLILKLYLSRQNSRKASSEFIRRILLVSEYYVQINEICRLSDRLRIIQLEVDPLCRKTFRLDGKDNVLYPDLYVELQSAKNRDRWFIELDLGFTSMNQIVERARQYHQYLSPVNSVNAPVLARLLGMFPVRKPLGRPVMPA